MFAALAGVHWSVDEQAYNATNVAVKLNMFFLLSVFRETMMQYGKDKNSIIIIIIFKKKLTK